MKSPMKNMAYWKDQHNISAEELNTTGEWCAICGGERSKHGDKGHSFKVYTPPGPDTGEK